MKMVESARADTESIAVSDHLRPIDHDTPAGVYRVVGATGEDVTLLWVTDADGRRVHTGEVHTIPRSDLEAFEAAENPDENRSLTAALASQFDGLYWQLRLIGQTVVDRPIPSTLALTLVAVGLFGVPILSIPDFAETLLFLVGVVSLLYLTRRGSPA